MNNIAVPSVVQQLQTLLETTTAFTTNMQEFTDHFFAPGIYLRTLFIPKGFMLVGKYHKEERLTILLKGKLSLVAHDNTRLVCEAPYIFLAGVGKKAGYAAVDSWIANIFPNPTDERDLDKLERMNILLDEEILQ